MTKKELCKLNRQKAIARMQASKEYQEYLKETEKFNAGCEENGFHHLETNRHYWKAQRLKKQARQHLRAI